MSVFKRADILIADCDHEKWSVVACDQFTSEPEYWEDVEKTVGSSPSSFNIVFPEAFLSEGDKRIEKINKTMNEYTEKNIFKEYKSSMIYVERKLPSGKIRRGIVGTIDLEAYDFQKGSKSLVRATEGTVLERIPPRVKIRENAPLELPHVMILINDEKKEIIENVKKGQVVYDFELMKNGGHLTGYLVDGGEADRVEKLLSDMEKSAPGELCYAVGDGNHSLATAKTCWENIKKGLSDKEKETHPARFCLVEIENIKDDALLFEPIHRVVFGVDLKKVLSDMKEFFGDIDISDGAKQHFTLLSDGERREIYLKNPPSELEVGSLQKFIDKYNYEVDYIHGDETVKKLSVNGNVGFILPKPGKDELFSTVIKDGALPRKTFSMGEANEKRYYMEAKKINRMGM